VDMFTIHAVLKLRIYYRYIIADSNTSALRTGDDDITKFLGALKVHRCW
jgi:hypothetical protein